MRIPFLLFATALLGSSAWAQDDESPYYLQLGFGGVFSGDAEDVPGGTIGFDPGFTTGLALGRSFGISERLGLDIDVEAYYQAFKVDEDDILAIPSAVEDDAKTFALMLNGTLDFGFTPHFSVYGGAGVGWASEIEYSAWDSGSLAVEDDDGLAFQGRLGFAYDLGGSYDVRLGYHFFQAESVEVTDSTDGSTSDLEVGQHSLEVMFRWTL
jgi:opacity protein-like surface antigen